MIPELYRHLLIPAYEAGLRRRPTLRYWRDLERSQWLAPEQLRAVQFAALKRLLEHASSNCPYYRETWKTLGLEPAALRTIDDFRAWPVTHRGDVAAHRISMRAPGWRLIEKATGGSSGDPLRFDLDVDSNDRRTAAWHRGYGFAGAAPGTRQFHLWGVPFTPASRAKRAKQRLYEALYRRTIANSFELGEATTSRFLAELDRCRPDVIVAYTNALYAFAQLLDERGLVPHAPRSIVVGAEALHEHQRQLIEKVFRAPVFETYGSREFMLHAAECERHDGLHVTAEHLLLEILDDDGKPARDGAEGQVVITDLYNFGMPFIRYANGDRAVAGMRQCSCGRGLPLMNKVSGRRLDVITTPDGRRIPGEAFVHSLKDVEGLRRFQIVQETAADITVRLILRSGMSLESIRPMQDCLRGLVGSEVRLTFECVSDIPLTRAGKLLVVVNRSGGQHATAAH